MASEPIQDTDPVRPKSCPACAGYGLVAVAGGEDFIYCNDGPGVLGDPMWGSPRAFGSREHAERKARKIMAKVAAQHDQERYAVPAHGDGVEWAAECAEFGCHEP